MGQAADERKHDMGWKGDACWFCRMPAENLLALLLYGGDGGDEFQRHMAGECIRFDETVAS